MVLNMKKRRSHNRTNTGLIGVSILATLTFFGCNVDQRAQELVQARLDAEKVKELGEEVLELKKVNEALKVENDSLKIQLLASQKVTQTAQAPVTKVAVVSKAKPKAPDSAASEKPKAVESPVEAETDLKKAATGGSSFK